MSVHFDICDDCGRTIVIPSAEDCVWASHVNKPHDYIAEAAELGCLHICNAGSEDRSLDLTAQQYAFEAEGLANIALGCTVRGNADGARLWARRAARFGNLSLGFARLRQVLLITEWADFTLESVGAGNPEQAAFGARQAAAFAHRLPEFAA